MKLCQAYRSRGSQDGHYWEPSPSKNKRQEIRIKKYNTHNTTLCLNQGLGGAFSGGQMPPPPRKRP